MPKGEGFKKMGGGPQYVSDFSFDSSQGFTGSCGKQSVKGYMRGGKVSTGVGKGGARQKMPPNVKAKGGKVHNKAMGGFMGPEREISVDDVEISMPRAKGGRAKKSLHDKMKAHGKKMGYMYGGAVKKRESIGNKPENIGLKKYNPNPAKKNTSKQFDMSKKKQDSMDSGVVPANRGSTQQEREAGGRGRLKPGFQKGGKAKMKGRADSGGGALADAAIRGAKKATQGRRKPMKAPDKAKGKGMSKKGFPSTVKAKGGTVNYMRGGKMMKGGSC